MRCVLITIHTLFPLPEQGGGGDEMGVVPQDVDWETVPNYRHALEARRGSSGPSGDGIIVKRLPRRSTSSSP